MQIEAPSQSWAHRLARAFGLSISFCLAVGALPGAEATDTSTPPEEAPELEEAEEVDISELKNWVDLSVGGVFLDGDKAQFMQRHQLPDSAFGGVEGFHWQKAVGEEALFKVDGRGIFDLHDYNLKLDLTHPDKGFIRAGYSEYRTWYDGSGGWLSMAPPDGAWFSLYDENLYVDRGNAWVEAGLTLPDWPVVRFKYSHQFREGKKDSTSWGDHSLTGSNFALDQRSIVPSYYDLDEVRDIFEGKITHTIKSTALGLGLRYETSDINNTLNVRRRPGELATDRYVTSTSGNDSDLFNVYGTTETIFSEKVVLTSGASFTTLENDLSGNRYYGSDYGMGYDPAELYRRQFGDQGYTNLVGGSELQEYVLNLNLMYRPWDYFSIVPSIRAQKQDVVGSSSYLDTLDRIGGTTPSIPSQADSDRGTLLVSGRLDMRYSRITNWVFYGRAEWGQDEGTLKEVYAGRLLGGMLPGLNYTALDTDHTRFTQKYTAGANWYPWRRINFGGQYYFRRRDTDYEYANLVRPPTWIAKGYPGFIEYQQFNTHDVNFRMTLRPLNNLTLVSRYDFQYSTTDMRGQGLSTAQSADVTSHIFSQSVTWVPWTRLYLQAGLNLVYDQTDTPANELTGSMEGLVQSSKNNYWDLNFMAGFTLNEKTDLQANYGYFRTDNQEDNSSVSVPYGADMEEHAVTLALIRRINPRLRWSLRYGYFTSQDNTSGRNNDYDAHLVYSSLKYIF